MSDAIENEPGQIRPSLTLIGADWCNPRASHVVSTDGRRQVELSRTWDGAWFSMTAYFTADEARQLAERFGALADEIAARHEQPAA